MTAAVASSNWVHVADEPEISVVLPCLDEATTLARCIAKARRCLDSLGVSHEIIVADNGSRDGSQRIAERERAKLVAVALKGYGSAVRGGIAAARGRYVIVGDADDSYDFADLEPFIEKLREGYELVVGNRFNGGITPRAMPALHRYIGNPVLSGIGRLLFRTPCRDFHCGLRGLDRHAIARLGLTAGGMELASEMVAKAAMRGLRMAEVPTTLAPDGRPGRSHLRPWRDGWRHVRLMLTCRLQGGRGQCAPGAGCSGPRPMSTVPSGFTLVELVIMVGIIAALAGILLPALVKARAEARQVSCLSNLRQLEEAWLSYATSNDGQSIPYARHNRGVWMERFHSDYGGQDSVRFCPAAQAAVSADFGSANSSWTYDLGEGPNGDRRSGSYGLNGWLLSWDPLGQGGARYSGGNAARHLKITASDPSVVPVFGDATWADGWPREDDPTPANLTDGDRAHQGAEQAPHENMMARFTIARHGTRVNIAFLDGHGETVPLCNLKRLKWRENFAFQDWSPPLPSR